MPFECNLQRYNVDENSEDQEWERLVVVGLAQLLNPGDPYSLKGAWFWFQPFCCTYQVKNWFQAFCFSQMQLLYRYVAEVKNSSPFRSSMNRQGRFVVSDQDPYEHPPAYHMPQLQMEMLAAGTQAGLLAMQSATRGVR